MRLISSSNFAKTLGNTEVSNHQSAFKSVRSSIMTPRSFCRSVIVFLVLKIAQILATPTLSPRADLPSDQTRSLISLLAPPNPLPPPVCFAQHSPAIFRPVKRADCLEVVLAIVARQDLADVRPWGIEQQEFPLVTGYQSCILSVGRTGAQRGVDRFSMLDVVQAAGRILADCVKQEQGALGGKVGVGSLGVFAVAVIGSP